LKVARCLLAASLVGLAAPAIATDADVIRLNGAEWRLHGISFPDADQVCRDGWRVGEASRAAIGRLTDGARLDCRNTAKDSFSRPVATCWVNGEDLGAALVRQGMAWAALRETWRYVYDDLVAWTLGNGLHAHGCEKPSERRARAGGGR
jgi:endonuclease YncB( thermonuclease family)